MDLERRTEEAEGDDGEHRHRQRRRKQAFDPSGIELEEGVAPDSGEQLEQLERDQVPGDHEEDVDADEAASYAEVGVVEDDLHHSDRPEPLDVGAEWARWRCLDVPRGPPDLSDWGFGKQGHSGDLSVLEAVGEPAKSANPSTA